MRQETIVHLIRLIRLVQTKRLEESYETLQALYSIFNNKRNVCEKQKVNLQELQLVGELDVSSYCTEHDLRVYIKLPQTQILDTDSYTTIAVEWQKDIRLENDTRARTVRVYCQKEDEDDSMVPRIFFQLDRPRYALAHYTKTEQGNLLRVQLQGYHTFSAIPYGDWGDGMCENGCEFRMVDYKEKAFPVYAQRVWSDQEQKQVDERSFPIRVCSISFSQPDISTERDVEFARTSMTIEATFSCDIHYTDSKSKSLKDILHRMVCSCVPAVDSSKLEVQVEVTSSPFSYVVLPPFSVHSSSSSSSSEQTLSSSGMVLFQGHAIQPNWWSDLSPFEKIKGVQERMTPSQLAVLSHLVKEDERRNLFAFAMQPFRDACC